MADAWLAALALDSGCEFHHFRPGRRHDVFPDGAIVFAVNDPGATVQPWGASEIQVILNFASELRERVGK